MAKMTQQMADIFRATKTFMLATASKDGVPNVAPMGMVILQDDLETIWIVDNYKADVVNLFNGRKYSGVTEIPVDAEAGSTYWFSLTPAK